MDSALYSLIREKPCDLVDWIKAHVNYDGHECLIWPFGRNHSGYAPLGWNRTTIYVHRIMCEWQHGPAPTAKHHAAHYCGNGHLGCVNPRHVYWATASENQLDRFRSQAVTPRQKLSAEDIKQIRALKGKESQRETALRFGVTNTTIRLTQIGKLHGGSNPRVIFTAEQVQEIRSYWRKRPVPEVASQFGVSRHIIEKIQRRETYKYIPEKTVSTQDAGGRP